MDGSSAQADDDAVITSYLVRVRKAARRLPRGRREWVIAHIGDRLADALEANDGASQDVRATLARFGQPRDVVLAVDGHNPGAEASWLEYAAILLALAGGVVWRPAWLAGVTLLWVSPRWHWQDKVLATLVWPGGLILANLLAVRYLATGLVASGGQGFFRPQVSTFRFLMDSTLGHPPLRHLLMLLLAAVPPVIVAIRLLRRARRPEFPQTAAALAGPAVTGSAVTGSAVTGPADTGSAVTGPGGGTSRS